MAQARAAGRGGFSAVHVWMIGFVFLWMASTVLLVWLYTDQEAIDKENQSLRSRNNDITRSKSQADRMLADIANIAIGEETDDVEVITAKVTALFERIVSDGLVEDATPFQTTTILPATTILYDEFKSQHQLRTAAEDRAGQAEIQYQELLAQHEELKTAFDNATAELKGRVDDIEANRAEYAAARDGEVDGFERSIDEIGQKSARDIQDERNKLRDEIARREELESRYSDLQAKVGELQITPGELLTLRAADGQVVESYPRQGVVYISLGRRHNLTPGLRFAVYPDTGIPPDGRAKAQIEVVQVHDLTAECNIASIDPFEVILTGDLVANPVYDPARPLRFVVVGEFDLNADGRNDIDGDQRIGSIITQWGGTVLSGISSRVDFVVAGFAPLVPSAVASDSSRLDQAGQERQRMFQRRLDAYDGAIASATELSIPILTQDVFLRFLGF